MDDVLRSRGVQREDLDFPCPRKIRDKIAGKIIDEWYMVGRELDVSKEKLTSIRTDNITLARPEEKAVATLDAWEEQRASKATCLELAKALFTRKKTNVLEFLCDEVNREKRTTERRAL